MLIIGYFLQKIWERFPEEILTFIIIKLSKVDFDWVKQKFPSRNFTGVLKGNSYKFIIVNRVTKTIKN